MVYLSDFLLEEKCNYYQMFYSLKCLEVKGVKGNGFMKNIE